MRQPEQLLVHKDLCEEIGMVLIDAGLCMEDQAALQSTSVLQMERTVCT